MYIEYLDFLFCMCELLTDGDDKCYWHSLFLSNKYSSDDDTVTSAKLEPGIQLHLVLTLRGGC